MFDSSINENLNSNFFHELNLEQISEENKKDSTNNPASPLSFSAQSIVNQASTEVMHTPKSATPNFDIEPTDSLDATCLENQDLDDKSIGELFPSLPEAKNAATESKPFSLVQIINNQYTRLITQQPSNKSNKPSTESHSYLNKLNLFRIDSIHLIKPVNQKLNNLCEEGNALKKFKKIKPLLKQPEIGGGSRNEAANFISKTPELFMYKRKNDCVDEQSAQSSNLSTNNSANSEPTTSNNKINSNTCNSSQHEDDEKTSDSSDYKHLSKKHKQLLIYQEKKQQEQQMICMHQKQQELLQNKASQKNTQKESSFTGLHKNKKLPEKAVRIMTEWYQAHIGFPYPNDDERRLMAFVGQISENQVKAWFANKRNRDNFAGRSGKKAAANSATTSQRIQQLVDQIKPQLKNNNIFASPLIQPVITKVNTVENYGSDVNSSTLSSSSNFSFCQANSSTRIKPASNQEIVNFNHDTSSNLTCIGFNSQLSNPPKIHFNQTNLVYSQNANLNKQTVPSIDTVVSQQHHQLNFLPTSSMLQQQHHHRYQHQHQQQPYFPQSHLFNQQTSPINHHSKPFNHHSNSTHHFYPTNSTPIDLNNQNFGCHLLQQQQINYFTPQHNKFKQPTSLNKNASSYYQYNQQGVDMNNNNFVFPNQPSSTNSGAYCNDYCLNSNSNANNSSFSPSMSTHSTSSVCSNHQQTLPTFDYTLAPTLSGPCLPSHLAASSIPISASLSSSSANSSNSSLNNFDTSLADLNTCSHSVGGEQGASFYASLNGKASNPHISSHSISRSNSSHSCFNNGKNACQCFSQQLQKCDTPPPIIVKKSTTQNQSLTRTTPTLLSLSSSPNTVNSQYALNKLEDSNKISRTSNQAISNSNDSMLNKKNDLIFSEFNDNNDLNLNKYPANLIFDALQYYLTRVSNKPNGETVPNEKNNSPCSSNYQQISTNQFHENNQSKRHFHNSQCVLPDQYDSRFTSTKSKEWCMNSHPRLSSTLLNLNYSINCNNSQLLDNFQNISNEFIDLSESNDPLSVTNSDMSLMLNQQQNRNKK